MKVYNQEKTEILENYDLEKGYLKADFIEIPEVEGVEEQGHYETIKEYPNGGKDVKWVVDVEGVEYQPAHQEEIEVYIPYTEEELAEEKKQARIEEIKTELTNLSQDFIQAEIGAVFDDLEQRKELFRTLHNELRVLLGKEPRQYDL